MLNWQAECQTTHPKQQAVLKKNRITLEEKQKKSHKLFPKNESETFSTQCRHCFLRMEVPFDAFKFYAHSLCKERLLLDRRD